MSTPRNARRLNFYHSAPNPSNTAMASETLKSFAVSSASLLELVAKMEAELSRGLSKELNVAAEIKQLPTYVTATPDGTGTG